jgi:hypothetical protein
MTGNPGRRTLAVVIFCLALATPGCGSDISWDSPKLRALSGRWDAIHAIVPKSKDDYGDRVKLEARSRRSN